MSDNINQCTKALVSWNSNVFSHVQKSIAVKKRELDCLLTASNVSVNLDDISECRNQLKELSKRKETIWKQRSGDYWVIDGDSLPFSH